MSAATDKRRASLRRLLADEPGLSDRAAARVLGCDHKTIARDRAWIAGREEVHRPPAVG